MFVARNLKMVRFNSKMVQLKVLHANFGNIFDNRFNSKMVQLKDCKLLREAITAIYRFNSKMVQLKDCKGSLRITVHANWRVSIPKWYN